MRIDDQSKNRLTATFRDPALEASYQDYARIYFTNRDRIMLFSAISIYLLYAILDYFTLHNARFEILALRLVLFVGASGLIGLTYLEIGKRFLQTVCIALMLVGGASISFMIWLEGSISPPYYVGLIMTAMILNNMVRISFRTVFFTLAFWYATFVPAINGSAADVDVFAAHFFVLNSFLLSGAATYFLELGRRDEFLKHRKNELYAEQLQDMVDDANRSIKRKNAVLNALTHVFKTPLHQIIGYSQIIEQESLGPHQVREYGEFSANIHSAGKDLLRVVQRILTYSRLDGEAKDLSRQATTTGEIIDCALSRLTEDAEKKKLVIDREVETVRLRVDGTLLELAICELISNAIDASSPGGTVAISAARIEDDIVFTVADHGDGIELGRVEEIQNTLERMEDFLGVSDKISLGVTLATKIAQSHGGRLSFMHGKGEDGQPDGTVATLTLEGALNIAPERKPATEPTTPDTLQRAS